VNVTRSSRNNPTVSFDSLESFDPFDSGADSKQEEEENDLFRFIITEKGDQQVEFLANLTGNTKGTHIATLVRRMVQSVQTRGYNPTQSLLAVDIATLYNALGSFRGVQYARNQYNSTVTPLK
jgi:hypothetical protein